MILDCTRQWTINKSNNCDLINTKKIDKYLQSVNSVKVTEAFLPTIFYRFLSVMVVFLHPPGAKGIALSHNSRNHRQTERTENNLAS